MTPPGYKQTEVGVIPEEWEAVQLQGKVSIAHGYAFASEHFASHGPYRLTTPGHFYEAGGFRDVGEKQKYYVGPAPSDYVLKPGDVIVAMTEQADGLLGSAALIPDEHGYLHNQRLGRVRTLSPEIELSYLVNVFNSPAYRAKVRETAAGTKVKHTSPGKLLEIFVRLPSPPEQRAIAEALSDVDGLLGALDRLIAKKRDLKQAAMQQLLTGQTRLSGFTEKWEVTTLGEITVFMSGGTPSRSNEAYWTGTIPWISASSLRCFYIFRSDSNVTKQAVKAGSKMAPIDSTLLLVRGSALHNEILSGLVTSPVCFNQDVKALVPTARLVPIFLTLLIHGRSDELLKLVSSAGNTAGVLDTKLLKAFEVSLPPIPEQTAIASILSEMDAELAALEQRREKTRALKQGMMQELLTGRTRLVESGKLRVDSK